MFQGVTVMIKLLLASLLICIAGCATYSPAATVEDSTELKELYDADQALRSGQQTNLPGSILQDERDRRFSVMQMLVENQIRTANDYFRAGIIIHHTGSILGDDGSQVSLGTESKILAFFLFRRSYELGNADAEKFMAAAYNYYLVACGADYNKFSYGFEDGRPVYRPNAVGDEIDELQCGFDPRPYMPAQRN